MFDFFNLKPKAFGLDISDLSLKIIDLEKNGNKLRLNSFGETLIKPGIIKRGEIRNEDALIKAIQKAVSDVNGKKIKTKYVVASLPEEKAFLQVIQMPQLPEKDLKSAVIYEAENYIPMPIEEVYFDSKVVPPIKNHLDHLDILIAAFPKKIVDSYLLCLKKAGLKPLALEVESLSIARSLIREELSQFPVLIIDFGATRTSFIIFSGYTVRFTFSIPVSSFNFTEAIAKAMKIDLLKAEKLKINYGLETKVTDEGGMIFEALSPLLTDLVEQIKKHIDYYQSHISHEHLSSNEKGVKKVLLCGGGSNLKGLSEFLSREINLSVVVSDPWINVFSEKNKVKKILCEKPQGYTTAIGLALRGADIQKLYD